MRPNFLLLISIFLGGVSAMSAESKKKPAASDCTGAWTGVVRYSRIQTQTDNKTVDRVSGRGKDTRNWEMHYDYKASVGIAETAAKDGSVNVQASITHTFTSKETNSAVETNSCDGGKTWKEMTGTFTSETKISGDGKEDANVHIGLNSDGTYTISVGIPEIKGTVSGSQTSTYSGQCTPKKGKDLKMAPTPTTIQGNSLTSDGSHHVDPDDPDRLAGSYTLPLPGGATETISWNLQRCAAPLRVIELKFEHMKFPKWNDWQEIQETNGTVDGNWVRIKATVFNASAETKTGELVLKETYKGDKWDGAKPDAPLKDEKFSITLDAGEERDVELLWDSSGFAWYDDGRPRLVQRIKAELREKSKKVDELTKNLKVLPKPLVMVAGIWTEPDRFEIYQNILTTSHSYGWKVRPVASTPPPKDGPIVVEGGAVPTAPPSDGGAGGSVYALADNLNNYVNSTRSALNAWHVDLLAHGTGGLEARLYVHKQMEVAPDGQPVVKHLLLLGTPNQGLPCADTLAYKLLFKDHPEAIKQMTMEEMGLFNKYVTERKGTKFSALAGNSLPVVCDGYAWGDGYIPVESAIHGIEDTMVMSASHNELLETKAFSDYVKPHVVTGPKGTYPLGKK